jgi:hypothetical protein
MFTCSGDKCPSTYSVYESGCGTLVDKPLEAGWGGFIPGLGQGCLINNYSKAVNIWSDANGDQTLAAGASSDCRLLGGDDIDHVQNPITGQWYKITKDKGGGYWPINTLPTATVNADGSVTGDACTAAKAGDCGT